MSSPSKYVILYEATGAANTAVTSPTLDTSGYDNICIMYEPIGGPVAAGSMIVRDAVFPTVSMLVATMPLDAVPRTAALGARTLGTLFTSSTIPVPPSIIVAVGAMGAGVAGHVKVFGRRAHKGPGIYLNAD